MSLFSPVDLIDKKQLRRMLRQNRQQLTPAERRTAEWRINRTLKQAIRRNKRLAVYVPIGSELRLHEWVKTAQRRGAQLYLPYIERHQLRLWFTPYPQHISRQRSGSLKKTGIQVPQFNGKKIRMAWLHTVIIPAVGIDAMGTRLGQGGGFYDCSLAHCQRTLSPKTIAAVFACQTVARLPREPHDARMNAMVSEYGWHDFMPKRMVSGSLKIS